MKTMEKILIFTFAALVFASCSKDGDGTDPFGGGGGNTAALVGNWTSTGATGTVGYGSSSLGTSLANVVNESIGSFNLNSVVVFRFETGGLATILDMGTLYAQVTYSLKDNTLTLTNRDDQTLTLSMNITMSGNEFTLDARGTDIAVLAAWAIGNAVLKTNGYDGMTEAGLQVSVADLTIKFQKQ
jgi:hypothetical protein